MCHHNCHLISYRMDISRIAPSSNSLWLVYTRQCRTMNKEQKQKSLGKYAKYQYKYVKHSDELDSMLTIPPIDEDDAYEMELEYMRQCDDLFRKYRRKLEKAC